MTLIEEILEVLNEDYNCSDCKFYSNCEHSLDNEICIEFDLKDRLKVPEKVELCPNPEVPCDCCPRGESVNCPNETEEEFFDNEDEARKKEDYERELEGEL